LLTLMEESIHSHQPLKQVSLNVKQGYNNAS
jgi:hypothetical protein